MNWINVEIALPNESCRVLCGFNKNGSFDCAVGRFSWDKKRWLMPEPWTKHVEVTHWMPLPDAPKKAEGK